jgi:hypothetical protein
MERVEMREVLALASRAQLCGQDGIASDLFRLAGRLQAATLGRPDPAPTPADRPGCTLDVASAAGRTS